MSQNRKAVIGGVVILGVALVGAAAFFLNKPQEPERQTWESDIEGFLAVAQPADTHASLWPDLQKKTSDGQHARLASTEEVVEWINTWPYEPRGAPKTSGAPLTVSAQSTEVRCIGASGGGDIPQRGDEVETVKAIRKRPGCKYTKWKVWSGETAKERRNERHTVWVDEEGRFRGRVDYWR